MGLDIQRGCGTGSVAERPILTVVGQFERCPKAWLNEDADESVGMFMDYLWLKRYGILPYEGSKLDQPSRVVHSFDAIEGVMMDIEAKAGGGHGKR